MRIVLSGYGKMGKVVEKTAILRGHEIAFVVDQPEHWEMLDPAICKGCTLIDFSLPAVAVSNIRKGFDLEMPVVIGTTGWNDQLETVREWVREEGKTLFYAANFSIGVNLVFEITKAVAGMMDRFPDYNISIEETHHVHKVDAPSGTAIKLAEIILKELRRKHGWVNYETASADELGVISFREDEVVGIHRIICESLSDKIILTHEAKDRTGLATGAVMAAEWIQGKTGFFEMNDLLVAGT